MSEGVIGGIVTLLSALLVYAGVRFSTKGNWRIRKIDAAIENKKTETQRESTAYDQLQEDLVAAREDARQARNEAAQMRSETAQIRSDAHAQIDDMWAKLNEIRQESDRRLAQTREAYDTEILKVRAESVAREAASELYISLLVDHINTGKAPPPPARPVITGPAVA